MIVSFKLITRVTLRSVVAVSSFVDSRYSPLGSSCKLTFDVSCILAIEFGQTLYFYQLGQAAASSAAPFGGEGDSIFKQVQHAHHDVCVSVLLLVALLSTQVLKCSPQL